VYKLIGIDMDGTLLNSKHTLSEENKSAIEKAREVGLSVVITTGRPLSGVETVLESLEMNREDDYIILYNGALILRASDRKILSESRISLDEVKKLEDYAAIVGVQMHIVTENACISACENKYGRYEAELNGMNFRVQNYNELPKTTKIYKVMFSEESEVLKERMSDVTNPLISSYETSMSAPFYVDFLKKGVNKGHGIKWLSQHIDVKQSQVICIGDAGNDLSMIRYASLGVAMGNASLELRKHADYITLSNDENGVAHVIQRFALGSEAM